MKNGKENKKIKLVIIGELIGGGVEKVNTILASNIDRHIFEVKYICLTTNPKDVKENYNFKIVYLCKRKNKYASLKLYGYLNSIQPDIILICNLVEAIVIQIYKLSHNVKSIYVQHSYFSDGMMHGGVSFYIKSFLIPKIIRLYKAFDAVVAVSNGVLNDLKKYFPEIKNSFVIYNPITNGSEKYIKREFEKSNIKLVTAGRLSQEKCQDLMIRAVAKLNRMKYNVTLDKIAFY